MITIQKINRQYLIAQTPLLELIEAEYCNTYAVLSAQYLAKITLSYDLLEDVFNLVYYRGFKAEPSECIWLPAAPELFVPAAVGICAKHPNDVMVINSLSVNNNPYSKPTNLMMGVYPKWFISQHKELSMLFRKQILDRMIIHA